MKIVLAMSLDMNDFVHVESLYVPLSVSRSGPALCSTSELLPTRDALSVEEHPMPARTMRPLSTRLTIPLSTNRGTGVEDFNVGKYLVDRPSHVATSGETRID